MRINGFPNKFEIFQDFYYEKVGVALSYKEAVQLFFQMDKATEASFIKYYADEVGYELLQDKDSEGNPLYDKDGNPVYLNKPYSGPNGYNLDLKFEVKDTGRTKTIKKKKVDSNGNVTYEDKVVPIFESNKAAFTDELISQKYTIEAYAKKRGLILDPIWSQYSAEEIIQMENDGVLIPQDILDVAHTIYETYVSNSENGEDSDVKDFTTEKEPFLELIPKAKKNIKKCEEETEKINDEIEDIVGESKRNQKNFLDQQQSKLDELKEYEKQVREWRYLQDKINNGEELTNSEARKYARLTGMLEEKNHKSSDFQMDKNKIAMELNDVNILAALGEQLAEETIEIGDTLAEYTSKNNYKATFAQASGKIGFLRAFFAMIVGKNLAENANEVGNNTKEYTEDTEKTINDIAGVLKVENLLLNPNDGNTEENLEPESLEIAENEVSEETDKTQSNKANEDTQVSQEYAVDDKVAENGTVENEEDFIINDENILGLIKEAGEINIDLLKEIKTSLENQKKAKDDNSYAARMVKLVDKMVKEYQEEEARRQEEVKTKEDENKDAKERIDELKGSAKTPEQKQAQEITKEQNQNPEGNLSLEDKKEIEDKQQLIDKNNLDIENLENEQKGAQEDFKQKVKQPQNKIAENLPKESEALKTDSQYKDEIIPADKERLDFTNASGKTLHKMGKYRITVGLEYLAAGAIFPPLRVLGLWHIARGTASAGIGLTAEFASKIPTPKLADKSTEKSIKEEEKAVSSLTDLDAKIISVTGEDETKASDENGENSEEPQESQETENKTEETNPEDISTEDTVAESKTAVFEESETSLQGEFGFVGATGQVVESTDEVVEKTSEENEKNDEVEDNSEQKKDEITENVSEEDSTKGTTSSEKDKKEVTTDKAKDIAKNGEKVGKELGKDSAHVKKDTEKDAKQLEKETKILQKRMKSDEKSIIKMTKESMKAAKKQEEILVRYEELTAENEEIASQEEKKKAQAPAQVTQPQEGGSILAGQNSFGMTDSSVSSSSDNAAKLEANNQEITILGGEFNIAANKINRNRTKIIKLEKSTKSNLKKVQKKTKIRDKKINEAEKKEAEKQKRLAKQLAAVGVAENVFSITLSTGNIMVYIIAPPLLAGTVTAAAGEAVQAAGLVMIDVGKNGIILCGVSKAAINFANGNAAGALVALGQTAITVAGSMTGASEGAGGVLGAVSNGMSIVASSAELVNNIRTLEGKEANSTISKISTIAGVASAVTTSAATLKNLGQSGSTLNKVAKVAGVVGSTMSSASQVMSEFKLGDENTAQLLGTVGGAISLAASAAQMATAKKDTLDSKNNDSKETTSTDSTDESQQKTDKTNDVNDKNETDGQNKKENEKTEDNKTNDSKSGEKSSESTELKAASTVKLDSKTVQIDSTEGEQVLQSSEIKNSNQQQAIEKDNATTTQTTEENIETNKETSEKTKAQKRAETRAQKEQEAKKSEEAKKAVETKEAEAKKADLSKDAKKNMTENGASEEFADVSDDELQSWIEGVQSGEGSKEDLDKLIKEQDNRKAYQEYKKLANKDKKTDKLSKLVDTFGKVSNTAGTLMPLFASDDKTDNVKNRVIPDGSKFTRDKRFKRIVASNENYFGTGSNEDEKRRLIKRRLKRFA